MATAGEKEVKTVFIPDKSGCFKSPADFGDSICTLCRPHAKIVPEVPNLVALFSDRREPRVPGKMTDYINAIGSAKASAMAFTKVRRCPCGKSVASSLSACNNCGRSLEGIPLTNTDNVFSGFLFGAESCNVCPLTISIRKETPTILVFDDLLSLTTCHFNAVPTDLHVPDIRFLFLRPAQARDLIHKLYEACLEVLNAQFLSRDDWTEKVLGISHMTEEQKSAFIAEAVVAGFNIPPSQAQLHLQFVVMPFLPFQQENFLNGKHFTHMRFFTYDYVDRALEIAQSDPSLLAGLTIDDSLDFGCIVDRLRQRGLDHDKIFRHIQDVQVPQAMTKYGCWSPDRFAGFVVGDKYFEFTEVVANKGVGGWTCKCVLADDHCSHTSYNKADTLALSNYGRPYVDEKGTRLLSYYRYSRDPNEIEEWSAI